LWYRFLLCTLLSCCIYIAGSAATAGSAEIHRVRHVWSHQRGIQFPPSSVSQASLFSTTAIFLFFISPGLGKSNSLHLINFLPF
jgi:hypothetical protein